jgi:hypothetical protein
MPVRGTREFDGDQEPVVPGVGDRQRNAVVVVGEGVVAAVAAANGGEERLVAVGSGSEGLDQPRGAVGHCEQVAVELATAKLTRVRRGERW